MRAVFYVAELILIVNHNWFGQRYKVVRNECCASTRICVIAVVIFIYEILPVHLFSGSSLKLFYDRVSTRGIEIESVILHAADVFATPNAFCS